MIKITIQEQKAFSQLILDKTGIFYDKDKTYLIESKLQPLLKKHRLSSFSELYDKIILDKTRYFERELVETVTNNETLFFRDTAPFNLLQYKIIPDLIDQKMKEPLNGKKKSIKIWSAGCSTGQEVYSIAIILNELFLSPITFDISILGTDISNMALKSARKGEYSELEVSRGVPEKFLQKYFYKKNNLYIVNDNLKEYVSFKQLNLLAPFFALGSFDIVFCRNVAIYFTLKERKKLFKKIADIIKPGGYLIIGSSENIKSLLPGLEAKKYLKTLCYRRQI